MAASTCTGFSWRAAGVGRLLWVLDRFLTLAFGIQRSRDFLPLQLVSGSQIGIPDAAAISILLIQVVRARLLLFCVQLNGAGTHTTVEVASLWVIADALLFPSCCSR